MTTKGDKCPKTISVFLGEGRRSQLLWDALCTESEKQKRSKSQLIRLILEEALVDEKISQKPDKLRPIKAKLSNKEWRPDQGTKLIVVKDMMRNGNYIFEVGETWLVEGPQGEHKVKIRMRNIIKYIVKRTFQRNFELAT